MKIQRRNNKNNRRHLSIKSLALMALFLFSVVAPIAGTWGAKARAATNYQWKDYDTIQRSFDNPDNTKKTTVTSVTFKRVSAPTASGGVTVEFSEFVKTGDVLSSRTTNSYLSDRNWSTPCVDHIKDFKQNYSTATLVTTKKIRIDATTSRSGGGTPAHDECAEDIKSSINITPVTVKGSWITSSRIKIGNDVYIDRKIDSDFTYTRDGKEKSPSVPNNESDCPSYINEVSSDKKSALLFDQKMRTSSRGQGCLNVEAAPTTVDLSGTTAAAKKEFVYKDTNTIVSSDGKNDEYDQDPNSTTVYHKKTNDNCPSKLTLKTPADPTTDTNAIYTNYDVLSSRGGIVSCKEKDKHDTVVASANTPIGTGPGSTGTTGDALPTCEVKLTNPLTWVVCPMINGARDLVAALNSTINDMLTLPTDKLFVTTNEPANQFYDSWSGFRYIAMGLLVIIALIMVLSQAIGVGPFDAYTIRKVLPRLLAAVVLVSLSWPLMKLAVDITNGIGHSVSGLIYGPFKLENGDNPSNLVMLGGLVGALGGGFVFGIFGALAFVATAALSLLSGMATLIFREMLIMFLVVVAPVAIICSILPNTQIVWKKWSDYFLRALIVFPIFSGVIAIGQVFAVIGPTLHTGAVGDLIQFIGYFGPYFMLPKIFAMSGGAVAAVGSVAQKATAGMRGGLSNYRNKKAGKRIANAGARAKAGDFIRGGKADDRGVRGRLNRTVAGLSTGTKGRFGIGEGGNQAIARNKATFGSEAARDPNFQQFLADSGDAATILAMSGGTASGAKEAVSDAVNGHMASWSQDHPHATPTDISTERRRLEERFNNAYEGARVMGFSRKNAIAAASNIGKHKAMGIATGDVGALSRGIQRLGGSTSEQQLLLGGAQYSARTEGTRLDLGGTIDNRNAIDERAVLMDSIKRTGFSAEVVGAPASTKQISRVAVADAARLGAMSLDDRTETAVMVSEAVTGLQYGTVGEARDNIVQMCTDLGISIDQDPVAIQEQIANAYGFTTTAPSPGAPPGPLPYINFGNRKRTADRVLPPGTSPAPPPSDVRLKKDIVYVGVNDSGIRLYRFKYLWSDTEYVGVMAQEVLHTHPEAVITDQWGYHRVDYGMLGIEFMTHETWKKEHIKKVKDSVS